MIKEEEKWDHDVATGLHSNNSMALAFGMEKLSDSDDKKQ